MSFLKFGCLLERVRLISPGTTSCEANVGYKRNLTRICAQGSADARKSQIFLGVGDQAPSYGPAQVAVHYGS